MSSLRGLGRRAATSWGRRERGERERGRVRHVSHTSLCSGENLLFRSATGLSRLGVGMPSCSRSCEPVRTHSEYEVSSNCVMCCISVGTEKIAFCRRAS